MLYEVITKVSSELLDSQVKAQPASTHAVEELLFEVMSMLENGFKQEFNVSLFSHDIDRIEALKKISRFRITSYNVCYTKLLRSLSL